MKKEYDASKAKKNPYAKRLKRRVGIRLDGPTVDYFKGFAEETGIPYQTLINLDLRDCADSKRELNLEWHQRYWCGREDGWWERTGGAATSALYGRWPQQKWRCVEARTDFERKGQGVKEGRGPRPGSGTEL